MALTRRLDPEHRPVGSVPSRCPLGGHVDQHDKQAEEHQRGAQVVVPDQHPDADQPGHQHRAEILFQQLLTSYPQSDKIDDAAYQLGDIYESKTYKQYHRAAVYYERCFQWNTNTQFDARLRAARLYDKNLNERGHAMELYREVVTHETDPKRIQEAQKRLVELSGTK